MEIQWKTKWSIQRKSSSSSITPSKRMALLPMSSGPPAPSLGCHPPPSTYFPLLLRFLRLWLCIVTQHLRPPTEEHAPAAAATQGLPPLGRTRQQPPQRPVVTAAINTQGVAAAPSKPLASWAHPALKQQQDHHHQQHHLLSARPISFPSVQHLTTFLFRLLLLLRVQR
jgi:hypothetical protein